MNKQFSDAAMGRYEPLIQRYVDLCISGLREQCRKSSSIDINEWFESFTFDLAGDLTFGEAFGGLRTQGKDMVPKIVSTYIKCNLFMRTFDFSFPKWLAFILKKFIPQYLLDSRAAFREALASKAIARLEGKTKMEHDLLESFTAPDSGVTKKEIMVTAMLLIVAGSETSATLLTAATYLLLTHPASLAKLTIELHSAFSSRDEINRLSTAKLRYLNAVLSETMRLYPSLPDSLPRRTDTPTETICNRPVPHGTVVTIYHWAINHSSLNFYSPYSFIPERWLQPSTNPGFTGPTSIEVDRRDAAHPFQLGPRDCIGRGLALVQTRLMLCHLLWEFEFEELNEGVRESWPPRKSYFLWEKNGLAVEMKERQKEGQGSE